MELLNAHIINFGKFSNLDVDFKKGLNSFIHENGWGKTTLSLFIKAMFYGFEQTTSKDADKNEKLKYLPWQGGIYGGNLSFSHNGKNYRITRTFSMKAKEESFEILDLSTNKPSSDFTSDLGNELFGINRETYGRSVHVVLEESPEGSTDISAKLNNLVEAGDVSTYDTAMDALNDKASSIKGRGQKGIIVNLQNEIDSCRNALSEIEGKLFQNEQYENKISSIRTVLDGLKKKQEAVTKQLSLSAKYEGKLRYDQLKKDVAEAEENLENLSDFFNGQIPEEESLSKIDEISREYTTLNSNVKNMALSESDRNLYDQLQKSFGGDIPEKSQIENCLRTDSLFKKFRQEESEKKLTDQEAKEYALLKQRFSGADISEEVIASKLSEISQIQNLKNQKITLEAEKSALQSKIEVELLSKKTNPVRIVFALLGFLTAGLGIAALVLKFAIPLICAAFGLMLLFTLLAVFAGGGKADVSELEEKLSGIDENIRNVEASIKNKEAGTSAFISQFADREALAAVPASGNEINLINKISIDFSHYSILQNKSSQYFNWLQAQPKVACDFENELKAFVSRFCKTEDISAVPGLIQNLNERLSKLQELSGRVNSDSKNNQLYAETKEKLVQILSQYKTDKSLDFTDQVQQLHNKINDIKNTTGLLENLRARVADFENDPQNDVKSFEGLKKPEQSADELRQQLSGLSEEINQKNSEISGYNRIIEANLAVTDKKADIENDIERLTLEKQEKTEEHKILTETMKFLEAAKEKLDANYIDPMKEGFTKYMKMISALDSDSDQKFMIDTDLKVTVDKDGIRHESKYLSAGYKDMINFCSRMALVDALFKDVKPPVILDDPFVNLDDDKVEHALKLVAKMAEEKQIIYFACHKSRQVK